MTMSQSGYTSRSPSDKLVNIKPGPDTMRKHAAPSTHPPLNQASRRDKPGRGTLARQMEAMMADKHKSDEAKLKVALRNLKVRGIGEESIKERLERARADATLAEGRFKMLERETPLRGGT